MRVWTGVYIFVFAVFVFYPYFIDILLYINEKEKIIP